jgi:small subunit ribosomal protein S14
MANKSTMVKNQQRGATVERYAERREQLKATIRSAHSGTDERAAVDGQPCGHLRKFGLSRVRVRELAHEGHLPGRVTGLTVQQQRQVAVAITNPREMALPPCVP